MVFRPTWFFCPTPYKLYLQWLAFAFHLLLVRPFLFATSVWLKIRDPPCSLQRQPPGSLPKKQPEAPFCPQNGGPRLSEKFPCKKDTKNRYPNPQTLENVSSPTRIVGKNQGPGAQKTETEPKRSFFHVQVPKPPPTKKENATHRFELRSFPPPPLGFRPSSLRVYLESPSDPSKMVGQTTQNHGWSWTCFYFESLGRLQVPAPTKKKSKNRPGSALGPGARPPPASASAWLRGLGRASPGAFSSTRRRWSEPGGPAREAATGTRFECGDGSRSLQRPGSAFFERLFISEKPVSGFQR